MEKIRHFNVFMVPQALKSLAFVFAACAPANGKLCWYDSISPTEKTQAV